MSLMSLVGQMGGGGLRPLTLPQENCITKD